MRADGTVFRRLLRRRRRRLQPSITVELHGGRHLLRALLLRWLELRGPAADGNVHPNRHHHPFGHSYSHEYGDAVADADCVAVSHRDTERNARPDQHAEPDGYGDIHTDPQRHGDPHRNGDQHAHRDTDSDADDHCYPFCERHRHGHGYPHRHAIQHAHRNADSDAGGHCYPFCDHDCSGHSLRNANRDRNAHQHVTPEPNVDGQRDALANCDAASRYVQLDFRPKEARQKAEERSARGIQLPTAARHAIARAGGLDEPVLCRRRSPAAAASGSGA